MAIKYTLKNYHNIRILILSLISLLILSNDLIFAQKEDENTKTGANDKTSPVILTDSTAADSASYPGSTFRRFFRQIQDSNYARAYRLRIKPDARFMNDLRSFTPDFLSENIHKEETLWQSFQRQFENIPQQYYVPLGVEVVQRYENEQRSMAVDGMTTLPKYNTGLRIPLSAIGDFLGVTEDLSPVLEYNLERRSEVVIVIYSVQARVIATVLNTVQPPGKYSIKWNGRDDNGRIMPPGDYVGEVRIGKLRYIRKRIKI